MRFSQIDDNSGLIQMCESLVFGDKYGTISGNSDLLDTFTRNINRGLDRVVSIILDSDTRWQFDDTNHSTYPIGTTDLVDGQQDYPLSTDHLKILSVEAKRENEDDWFELRQTDITDIKKHSFSITDYREDKGQPDLYDLTANSVFLYPPPNYNRTDGLKVYFQRGPDYFDSSDTSKEPGFNTLYHEYLAYWASYQYAFPKRMDMTNTLRQEIQLIEDKIREDYQKRNKDWRSRMTARVRSAR